jgi:endo-1,3-1,4-beta-glycanase ExoK
LSENFSDTSENLSPNVREISGEARLKCEWIRSALGGLIQLACATEIIQLGIHYMAHRFLPILSLVAILTATAQAGAVSSAELYRTTGEGFGKFEARLRFAAGDGIISSFFLWKDGSELSTAYWNELDFEKLGAECELQTNSIYGMPEQTHEQEHPGLTGLCDGYHTYAYEWTPDYIAYSLDGVELRRDTGADAAAYAENATTGLQARFNIWPGNANFGGTFVESSLPAYQYIDWAQYSTYTPGAGDEGSDFTLKWREEFDSLPAGWATGSWGSPLNLSTHSPANVVFVDGIAVLALTADDQTGYTGTPPQDDSPQGGESNGAGGSPGASGGAPVASGGSPSTASGGAPTTPPANPPSRMTSGCSLGSTAPITGPAWAYGVLALLGVWGRVSSKKTRRQK